MAPMAVFASPTRCGGFVGHVYGDDERISVASSPENAAEGSAADSRSVSTMWERSLCTGPAGSDGWMRR